MAFAITHDATDLLATDTVDAWMRGASRFNLLTPSEELLLAARVRTWLDTPNPTPQQIRSGRRAKERMINCNLRLAAKCAFSFRRRIEARGGDIADAMQEAAMGLNRAAEKFDPTRGYKYSTYATLWCNQAVRRYIQVSLDTIRSSSNAQDLIRRLKYKGNQSMEEFCQRWGYSEDKIQTELRDYHRAQCRSLDQQVNHCDGEGTMLLDLIADEQNEPNIDHIDLEQAVARLEGLLPDDFALVEMSTVDGHSNGELGELLDMTRNRVSYHLVHARQRLAAAAGADVHALVA